LRARVASSGGSGKRPPAVGAAVRPGFINYLYFMFYTVTTTGYGDMHPVTAQAKFVATLGNVYELLFLLLVVGAVLGRGGE